MTPERSSSDKIWLVLKGLAMGAANKVPGVSGGVVAFVAGFYEEFIYSLQRINKTALKLILGGRFKSFYTYINGSFLSLLILGMVFSYFSISKILDYLIIHFELYVWSAFFGMIIGSIYYIAKDFGSWNRKYLGYLCSGIAAGIAISFLEPARENDHLIFVFFCGIIGVSGMTLPGLSGSFILILLGNYVLLLVDSVNALFDTIAMLSHGDLSFIKDVEQIRLLKVLAVFSIGSLVGLVSLSHILGYVLKRFKKATYAVIIGFITGSLGVVWPWKEKVFSLDSTNNINIDANGRDIVVGFNRFFPSEFSVETILALCCIFAGILIVLSLDWYHKMTRKKMAKFGLIGRNIGHSFSKNFFSKKFDLEGLDHQYENFDINSITKIKKIIKENTDLKGLNVTIPYKEQILPFLDRVDKEAKAIGAVNTIKINADGRLFGYNTDHYGFAKSLAEFDAFEEKTALILGSGGASKAIEYVLQTMNFDYKVVSRTPTANQISYRSLNAKIIESHKLIINTTPLGTSPNILECPDIPYQHITPKHFLYDLIYNPSETEFLKRGFAKRATISNGMKMLEFQAKKAWEIWNK